MRRILSIVCILAICFLCFGDASAAGFCQNGDAIEKAADSVLQIAGLQADNPDMITSGSGFIAFNNKTIITNYHVIDGLSGLYAWDDEDNNYENGYEIKYILCADKEADIAILEFAESTSLTPLELYPDDQLKRGSPVVAIGSPAGGAKNTVTTGVISSQFINDKGFPEIQISAPITHGSSGGALFNDDGKVIGVTSSGYDGVDINFAINIAVAQAMYNAWDGTKYSFSNYKSTAKMDFTDVYKHQANNAGHQVIEKSVENAATVAETWTCPNCGRINSDKFCLDCGTEKPSWTCVCGRLNSSKFCGSCGRKVDDLVAEFNLAMAHVDINEYEEAVASLTNLGEFNSGSFDTVKGSHVDAKGCIPEVYYNQGLHLVSAAGDHDAIISSFNKAGNFGDAKDQIKAENDRYYGAFYASGVEKASKGEYAAAIAEFEKAGDYSDAKDKIKATYYQYGLSLLNNKEYELSRGALKKAGEYSDAATMILRAYYEEGLEALGNGKADEAVALFEQAGEYQDAKAQIEQIADNKKERIYNKAIEELNKTEYEKARDLFASLSGYKDADKYVKICEIKRMRKKFENFIAKDAKAPLNYTGLITALQKYPEIDEANALIKEINYRLGDIYFADKSYKTAISYFSKASDYSDASEKLKTAKVEYVDSLLSKNKYEEAYDYINNELVPYGIKQEYILLKPGDDSEVAEDILKLVKDTGFNKKIALKEREYKDSYIDAVTKFEEYFGMTVDGNITLNEYMYVKDLIYNGVKGEKVKALVEKLADLSYLKNLQKDHTVCASGYVTGIKNAEKALGLKADGYVTTEEYNVILDQKVEIKKPENLKMQVNNDTVTLTWSKVSGAVKYKVYEVGDGEGLKTSYKFLGGNNDK